MPCFCLATVRRRVWVGLPDLVAVIVIVTRSALLLAIVTVTLPAL